MQQEMKNVVSELQLLRLAVLPIYANDDDESERDLEEYITFYRLHIHEGVEAINEYIESFVMLMDNYPSTAALDGFIDGRKRFVATFPFCYDDSPPVDKSEAQDYREGIRAMFRTEERWCRLRESESLRRFRELLEELQTLLCHREEGKLDAH